MRATRLLDGPIVGPASDPSLGANICGPSIIRVPPWLEDPLGRYYLYFADHKGTYIRLAYADELTGPWRIHAPGSLQLADSCFLTEPPDATASQLEDLRAFYEEALGSSELAHSLTYEATTPHIASPDVHVDHEHRRIVMYFHGLDGLGVQLTRVALSVDGLRFEARPDTLALPYLRAFPFDGQTYGLTMPGGIVRSSDGLSRFETGPTLFEPRMRHAAVLRREQVLHVIWTRVGDAPERLLHSTIDLSGDWTDWANSEPVELLRPELEWEGAHLPAEPSIRSSAPGAVNQLRDPAILDDDGTLHLLYAVAGEGGIALAELHL